MVKLTPSAVARLRHLLAEHPEDPVVRLTIRDLDEERLALNITLESSPQSDDDVHTHDGLTIAVGADSVLRLDRMTLDYQEPTGFHLIHPHLPDGHEVDILNRNGGGMQAT